MAIQFPSGKNVLVELLDLAVDDIAPSVTTLGNYISFLGQSNNFKIGQARASSSTPAYGTANITTSGYSSFNMSGDILIGLATTSISAVNVSAAGTGYTSAPTVVFTGGAGTGATGVAVLNTATGVSKVRITNPGTGYTSAPTMTFTGGAGTGATATSTINRYSDGSLWPFRDADFITFRISPFGTGTNKPYYYGTIAPTTFDVNLPADNLVTISLAGDGTGSLGRGEWT